MKFTYNWLKDFVDIKLKPEALAQRLTMAGLEVKGIEEKQGDFVFEAEITSNRPDWLSVIGVAREVAAITGARLKTQKAKAGRKNLKKEKSSLKIEIEDKKDCPLYTAKIICGLKVAASPKWLSERLEAIGCRSINNLVDITNYVMFTWGEPLHAFDLDRLSPGEIIVRRAKKGEKILTIDGTARELDPGILIIADSSRPVAVAGVMGGKDTEVSTGTKNILLEAAVFDAALVRKGRQKLGLSTDSSYRFERGIDFETAQFSSWQAVGLIEEIASGECVLAKEEGAALPKTKSVIFDLGLTQKTLNVNIAAAKIKKILENLGFGIKSAGKNKFSVKIPSFREDVALPEDLVEEVTRVYGYEAIPETVPYVLPRISACQTRDLVSLTKNILVSLGLHEAITYSLVDKGLLKGFVEEGWNPVEIANPLSIEQEVLRTSLVPSLTRCVAFNLNQKQDYVNLFEVAGIFLPLDKEPKEELALGIALSGTRSYLLEQGLVKEEVTFLHLKGVIERLFERLGIKEHDFKVLNSHNIEIVVKDSPAGRMYQLEKNTLDRFDIKNKEVFVAQLSLAKLFAAADLKKKFLPPPKYPGITRDISFLIKEGLSVKEVLNSLYEKGRPLMRQAEIADYYKGKQVPQGFRSLTVSCLYRSDERTLTESEVTPVHNEVLRLLTEGFGAKIR